MTIEELAEELPKMAEKIRILDIEIEYLKKRVNYLEWK